jgi:hypothetical protein
LDVFRRVLGPLAIGGPFIPMPIPIPGPVPFGPGPGIRLFGGAAIELRELDWDCDIERGRGILRSIEGGRVDSVV